jgi:alpha-glucosidase
MRAGTDEEHRATVACVVNLTAAPVSLPPHRDTLLSSRPIDGDLLAADAAAWLVID